ncbi:class 3 adenylate cyclase [Kibdelosporangium banguiense]|uniref:Class 3 adenylate cyclase n=1 Tax=Kibdelosporangium banguiense TaxID=1365924 RepID=A0ABS4TTR9_9PSEU|nr:hypothetical protein [Kibdelosporangium banguiense]MBP2327365.1 class 3 adenylate cyclase [Kibdelosporangium banguiense]
MGTTTQLPTVAVVLVRARSQWDSSGDPDRTATELSNMDTVVREEVSRFDGFVAARVGTLWQAVFGARTGAGDHDERAVLAALNIRRRLTDGESRTVRAAVVSSEVSIKALDDCHTLLPRVPSMEVWVSEQTHQRTESKIDYRPATSGMWSAAGLA